MDAKNHPLKNSKVTLSNKQGVRIANFTDSLGAFNLIGTPYGDVNLIVEAPGFETAER